MKIHNFNTHSCSQCIITTASQDIYGKMQQNENRQKKNKRKRMNKNGHNHSKRLTQVKCAHTMLDGNEQLKRAVEMHYSHIQFGLSLVFTVSCANDNL